MLTRACFEKMPSSQACQMCYHCLKSIGFTNFVPCLNGVLVPEMRDRDAMLIALVRLRLHLNRNQSKNLIQGCLELIPGRLSLRGAPAWRNGLSTRKVLPNIDMQQIPPKDVRVQVHTDIQDFMLHCPSCGNQKQAANHSLYNKGRWAVFKCSVCVCSRTVRAWQCICNACWFSCPLHASIGFACKAKPRTHSLRRPKAGTLISNTNDLPPPRAAQIPDQRRPDIPAEALPL